jgi:hypothetical protein
MPVGLTVLPASFSSSSGANGRSNGTSWDNLSRQYWATSRAIRSSSAVNECTGEDYGDRGNDSVMPGV